MKSKTIQITLAFLASFLVNQCALAMTTGVGSTFNLGLLDSTPTVKYVQQASGSVFDRFYFSIGTQSDATLSATNVQLSTPLFDILNIPNLSMSVFESNTNVLLNGPTASGQSATINLAAGNYYAQVSGNITGLAGGSYLVSMAALPVPVPAAIWLLGSGLIGLVSVSRRKLAK